MDKPYGGKFVFFNCFILLFLNILNNYTVTGQGLKADPFEIHEGLVLIFEGTTLITPLSTASFPRNVEIDPLWEDLEVLSLGDLNDGSISTKSGFYSLKTIRSSIFSDDGVEETNTKKTVKKQTKSSGNKKSPKRKAKQTKAKTKNTSPNTNARKTRSRSALKK